MTYILYICTHTQTLYRIYWLVVVADIHKWAWPAAPARLLLLTQTKNKRSHRCTVNMTGLAVFPRKARSLRLHHQNFRLCTIVRTIRCGLFNVKFRSQTHKDQICYEGKTKCRLSYFVLFIGKGHAALFFTFHRLGPCSTVFYFPFTRLSCYSSRED